MNSHLEITIRYKDDLRVDKVHWQWRGEFNKNGSSYNLIDAYDAATDAYAEAHPT